MFCRKCGTEIKENAKFCVKCGTPVVEIKQAEKPQKEVKQQKEKTAGKKVTLIVCIVLICVAVLALGAGITVWVSQSNHTESEESKREDSDQKESDEESQEAESEGTQEESQEDAQGAVQEESQQEAQGTVREESGQEAEGTAQEDTQGATQEEVATGEPESGTEHMTSEEAAERETAIHSYKLVMKDVSWSEAYKEALEIENGYLVRINSDEEMEAVIKVIREQGQEKGIFWIAGMRSGESTEYHWIDEQANSMGEPLNENAHWLEGEPTYRDETLDTEEKYMNMFYLDSEERFVWNDTVNELVTLVPGYSGRVGYIVEIENE